MASSVSVDRGGRVAVVTIENPPVNALSHHVRAPLVDALTGLRDDAAVNAIVLMCAGRTFVAGADITEFGKPLEKPELADIIAVLETIRQPTVAAIHGTALGGGLELALGCHYRIADSGARLGLPEVKLGLLPGGGGTVRLPRLVGPSKALSMIVSGTPVSAMEALDSGLVDEVAEGDLRSRAIAFAAARAASGQEHQIVASRNELVASADLDAFDAQAAELAKKARGLEAPIACAESIRNSLTMPVAQALAAERSLFRRLVTGEQSLAQRHLFFAEREAGKVPGIGKEITARAVASIGVVGAGTMGGGIAMAFANAGMPVTLVEISADALQHGLAGIARNYDESVRRGTITGSIRDHRMALITPTTDYGDLAGCDLIVEAVFEDMEIKREVLGRIDAVARQGAIIATNTSYLDVNALANATGRPGVVVGLHFFSPAQVMKLVEIVRGAETSADVVATALALARRVGKIPVVVGVCHGFVGNRMLQARNAEIEGLLLEGATPTEVDAAFTDFGWPMGPFAMADFAGLDIGWRNRKAQGRTAAIADALCEQRRFGQKTGAGFYLYPEGSRKPVDDPAVLELIETASRKAGVERRSIAAGEIVERTLYPMINEGARILDEGIALRSSDIDIVWVNGYGFPVARGGPMFFAVRHGLADIVERLRHWHLSTGRPLFEPSTRLVAAAAGEASL